VDVVKDGMDADEFAIRICTLLAIDEIVTGLERGFTGEGALVPKSV
jgi:hypothetical protein